MTANEAPTSANLQHQGCRFSKISGIKCRLRINELQTKEYVTLYCFHYAEPVPKNTGSEVVRRNK